MGIKHFANVPCGPCGKDTLHLAMKCRECGNAQLTPAEQRNAAIARLKDAGKMRTYQRASRKHAKAQRLARSAVPTALLARGAR